MKIQWSCVCGITTMPLCTWCPLPFSFSPIPKSVDSFSSNIFCFYKFHNRLVFILLTNRKRSISVGIFNSLGVWHDYGVRGVSFCFRIKFKTVSTLLTDPIFRTFLWIYNFYTFFGPLAFRDFPNVSQFLFFTFRFKCRRKYITNVEKHEMPRCLNNIVCVCFAEHTNLHRQRTNKIALLHFLVLLLKNLEYIFDLRTTSSRSDFSTTIAYRENGDVNFYENI